MPCFYPIQAFRVDGDSRLSFNPRSRNIVEQLKVPCGRCIGCRLERSRQWAVRCMHEMTCHSHNCFVTLTYAPEYLPDGGTLVLRDFQLFLKRLRKRTGAKIRFFHCGEYGEKLGRPHYHVIFFGWLPSDLSVFKKDGSHYLYNSKLLSECWPYGFAVVAEATFEAAAYVARYVLKKVNGDCASDHYSRVSPDGLVYTLKPEYVTMSRRPGIASEWFDKFGMTDVYPSDEVIVKGRSCKPPRYYDDKLKVLDPFVFDDVKHARYLESIKSLDNNSPARLDARREVQEARLSRLPRKLEMES